MLKPFQGRSMRAHSRRGTSLLLPTNAIRPALPRVALQSLYKKEWTLKRLAASHWMSLHRRVFCQALSVDKDGWLNTKSVKAAIPSGYFYHQEKHTEQTFLKLYSGNNSQRREIIIKLFTRNVRKKSGPGETKVLVEKKRKEKVSCCGKTAPVWWLCELWDLKIKQKNAWLSSSLMTYV